MTVNKSELAGLSKLGEGQFGRVFKVALGLKLKGEPLMRLAYKEYTKDKDVQIRMATAAVDFRRSLSRTDRDTLDRFTAWPRELVEDDNGPCGVLVPLLSEDFMGVRFDPDLDDGTLQSVPRALGWIAASAEWRELAGVDLDDVSLTDRLLLLAQLVYIAGFLHRRGWVFGDLSFTNVVFSLDPARIMLIDCDAAASLSDDRRAQGNTFGWFPPECKADARGRVRQKQQDSVTDCYKLGLAILRVLVPGDGLASRTDAAPLRGVLDGAGFKLVARALRTTRDDRPTARDLYMYFHAVASARIKPPRVVRARLGRRLLVRGQDLRIEWELEDADEITICGPNALEVVVAYADHPDGYSLPLSASGPIQLTVCNPYAEVDIELGTVTLYELPSFDLTKSAYLPRAQVPPISALVPPMAMNLVSDRPLVEVGSDVPRLQSPEVARLFDDLMPAGLPVEWPRLDLAFLDATQHVRQVLLDRTG